jgi:hypothetical protein
MIQSYSFLPPPTMSFQLIIQKLEQNPHLIVPLCVAFFLLLKFLIFAAKLAFMPCGVNVNFKR